MFSFLFYAMQTVFDNYGVVDPHHVDADPDSDFFYADPDFYLSGSGSDFSP